MKRLNRSLMAVILCVCLVWALTLAGCRKNETEGTDRSAVGSAKKTTVKASAGKATGTSSKSTTKTTTGGADNDGEPNGQNGDTDGTDPDGDTEDPADHEEDPAEEVAIDYGGKTITIAIFQWGLPPPTRESPEIRHQMMFSSQDDVEAKYNCHFELLYGTQNNIRDSVINSTLAGIKYCDAFTITPQVALPAFLKQSLVAPIDDYLNEYDYKETFKYIDFETDVGTWSGKRYGVMQENIFLTGVGMWFNKDVMDNEGLAYPYDAYWNKTWNWDMMLDYALKSTKDFNGDGITDQWGLMGLPSFDILYANGGGIVEFNDNWQPSFALDTPQNLRAINFLVELAFTHKVVDRVTTANYQNFAGGRHAMWASGTGQGLNFIRTMNWLNFGFVAFPMGPDATDYVSTIEEAGVYFFSSLAGDLRSVTRIFLDYWDVNESEPYFLPIDTQQNERVKATRTSEEDARVWYDLLQKQSVAYTNYFSPLKGRVTAAVINPAVNMTTPLVSAVEAFRLEAQTIIHGYMN